MRSAPVLLCLLIGCRSSAPPLSEGEAAADRACGIVRAFASAHGWGDRMSDCFYDDVRVFETQEGLFDAIRAVHGLPPDAAFPDGVVAALEQRHLMVVTPQAYARIAPAYARQDDAWTRLMAHEIGHRLHVAILDGDEDAMGPPWFFEGFAVVAAGQQLGDPLAYETADEALAAVYEDAPLAYRRFGAAVRFFGASHSLPTLVARAGGPDFESWLTRPAAAP